MLKVLDVSMTDKDEMVIHTKKYKITISRYLDHIEDVEVIVEDKRDNTVNGYWLGSRRAV